MELLEALGAVSTLEDEGAAHGGLGEALLEVTRLSGEHHRRERLDRLEHGVQLLLVRVLGELQRLLRLPAVDRPLPLRCRLLLRRRHRRGRGLGSGGGGGDGGAVVLRRVGGVDGGDGAPLQREERGRAAWLGRRAAGYGSCGGGGCRGVGGERHCEAGER